MRMSLIDAHIPFKSLGTRSSHGARVVTHGQRADRVLSKGKKSDLYFYIFEFFQQLVSKKTVYHNEITMSYDYEPLLPANLK